MKKIYVLLVAILLMASVATAQAEVKAGSVSITPFAGWFVFEGNQDLKDHIASGLRIGYNFTEHVGLEAFGSFTQSEAQELNGPWVNVYHYGADFLYHFFPESFIVPFLAVGIGNTTYDVLQHGTVDRLTVDYGGGLKIFLTEDIALRADVRHVLPLRDTYNDMLCSVGIDFAFGGKKKVPPPPPDSDNDGVPDNLDKCPNTPAGVAVDADGCPIDSDKDGVPDYLDKCPNTPAGVVVDANGCPIDSDKDGVADYLDKCPNTPAGVVVDANGCPIDSDKDGVADYLDKCPDTPAGVVVDANGCPIDSDKDGVADYLDKCPDTPAGVAVDKDGCPIDSDKDGVPDYLDKCPNTPAGATVDKDGCMHEKVTMLLNVEFDTAKFNIKNKYRDDIKKVADFMNAHPDVKASIEGHTDTVGKPERNMTLSDNRAKSVREYLIKEFGIDENRITATGFGQDRPIASNDTAEGRQKNRRVEAVLEAIEVK